MNNNEDNLRTINIFISAIEENVLHAYEHHGAAERLNRALALLDILKSVINEDAIG